MITSETPEKEELRYLASLITPEHKRAGVVFKPKSLTDNNIIERMDHHGVTMLAFESGTLSDNIINTLTPRKALMIANSDLRTRGLNKVFKNFNDTR